jgi:surface polysaccharide O-acyltransferase-like enzyme
MTTEIDTQTESSEGRKRLRLLAAVLATGVALEIAAVVAENRALSEFLTTPLLLVELIVCGCLIATTVEVAEERSPRTLFLASLVITGVPFASLAILSRFMPGGHDSATFTWMYFTLACTVSGLPLMIVAGVRFVTDRRKRRASRQE